MRILEVSLGTHNCKEVGLSTGIELSLHSRDVEELIRREAIEFGSEKNILLNFSLKAKMATKLEGCSKKLQERKRLLQWGRNSETESDCFWNH